MTGAGQTDLPEIPCVILAGGLSRRFGSNKALAELQGERLIDRAARLLAHQTRGPIVVNAAEAADFESYEVIEDRLAGNVGPLAGIHAAMGWAKEKGFDAVITAPVDTPLLPNDFVARLIASGAPSIASSLGRSHSVHGLWPVSLLPDLERATQEGMRAAGAWAETCGAAECKFAAAGTDPFFNVNTPDDLAELARSLGKRT